MSVEDRSTTWGYAGTDFAKNTDVVLSFSVSIFKNVFKAEKTEKNCLLISRPKKFLK